MPMAEMTPAAKDALDWAREHGLLMRERGSAEGEGPCEWRDTIAPFALTPSPIPASLYKEAIRLQPLFNQLVANIVLEQDWLDRISAKLAESDEFVKRLHSIWSQCRRRPRTLYASVNRSDYMMHSNPHGNASLKQVELNTISASFAHLGGIAAEYHRQQCGALHVPKNTACGSIASAIDLAVRRFCDEHAVAQGDVRALMVVHPLETNYHDQEGLSKALPSTTTMVRMTFQQMRRACTVGPDGILRMGTQGEKSWIVPLVYFRTGYAPDDYDEGAWQVRLMIEESNAVLIPDIGTHLAGLKKVQQEIARPGALEKFISDPASRALLAATFMGLHSLDGDEEGDRSAAMALAHPHNFILKPQREGGGHNVYGEQIPAVLRSITRREREAYILMERIRPASSAGRLLRPGKLVECSVFSELGVFGTMIVDRGRVLLNDAAGYLLRTKPVGVDEGGVAAGFAYLDAPSLI